MTMEIQHLMWRLEELATTFREAAFSTGDVDAALACLTDDGALTHVPTGAGGHGHDAVRRHLIEDVVPHRPADLAFQRLSRTADQRRLVEELTVTFTHDRPMPWLLPDVEPTGRHVEVLAISVVGVSHRSRLGRTTSLISSHRTLWDHAGLMHQLRDHRSACESTLTFGRPA